MNLKKYNSNNLKNWNKLKIILIYNKIKNQCLIYNKLIMKIKI